MGLYDRLSAKTMPQRKVVIPLADGAVQAASAAEREYERAKILGNEETQATAKAKHEDAQRALRDASVTIVVQALPRADWDALQRANPATTEQVEEAKRDFGSGAYVPYNSDTFLPAAWEACQIPPDGDDRLTYEQCAQLVKSWSQGEQTALLRAIQDANQTTVSPEALGE